MASNQKKNNNGRKSAVNNSRTAPRHHPVTNNARSAGAPTKPASTTTGARTGSTPSTVERKPTEFTRQQIAEAAYFLWQKRGGCEESNWLEAERLLKAGLPVR